MRAPPKPPPQGGIVRQICDVAAKVDARGKQASAQDATTATQPAGGAGQGGSDDISAAAKDAQAACYWR